MALTSKHASDLDTPHGRHHQVEHHRVCLQPVCRGEGFQSVVAAGRGEAGLLEVAADQLHESTLVIDDDYVHTATLGRWVRSATYVVTGCGPVVQTRVRSQLWAQAHFAVFVLES
jgi:hypothetical protein